ncbi:MAG: pseudouridine synthase [Bacillota bacterium]|jgi:23S rRNA pseudouridine2605 synthase|nr:rRNA pseudouridine synthase [Bacillota bacterium]HOB90567.1 pseudouridine synthase [Bacillota bacterium]HPZ53587.1 pseudouridine synthase [Bacillota bacterium]HQD17148.1 pseudouridine synthase [Bacillota bacterium]
MDGLERLQRYLARCGVGSRRACEKLISDGRVSVNGKLVVQLGIKIDPMRDVVAVDGKPVVLQDQCVYIALHKPKGVLTSASDPYGRPVVTDLVTDVPYRVFPVGRLDMDSEGLLLLTNDGELAYRLTHPKYMVPKTYLVTAVGEPSPEALDQLRTGIALEDGITSPAEVRRYSPRRSKLVDASDPGYSHWLVTIHEGRKRQVRRMFDALGHPVKRLVRTRFGSVPLGGLAPGSYRHLSREEVRQLQREVGLTSDR